MSQGVAQRVEQIEPSIIRQMFALRRPTSIDLSLGEPALPPDPALLERAWTQFRAGPHGYTENAGMPALRAAIALHYQLPGRSAAENVLVTVGSEEAVYLAMLATLDPGQEVLVPSPGYPAYRNIARLVGAVPIDYPIVQETGLVARAEALRPLLSPKTRLLILNSPSNPFGTIDQNDQLELIAVMAERSGFQVLSDEIYRDLIYRPGVLPSIAQYLPSSLVVSGLSKSCSLTGFRLGFVMGDAHFIQRATLAHQLIVTCAPRIAQQLALEIFQAPQWLRANLPYYEQTREMMRKAAQSLPADAPLWLGDGAFYGVLDVSRYAENDPMALARALLDQQDVVVVPGTAFGPDAGRWFWRISYAAGPEATEKGIARIADFLSTRRKHPNL